MTEVRIFETLDKIDACQWNACFQREAEDYDYLQAIEKSGMTGFLWRYLTAWKEGMLVAATPAFLTDYSLDTTLDGAGKKITGAIRSVFPKILTMKLSCVGSPCTEYGLIGFHPSVAAEEKQFLLKEMIEAFELYAVQAGYSLIGLKDIPAFQSDMWEKVIHPLGYKGIPGLPVAGRDIDFSSLDEYFKTLSYMTRKNMRRKLKAADRIRIEYRDNIDDVIDDVMALYKDTRSRAEMQFEELRPRFFQNVLSGTHGRGICTLYFKDKELLAANLLINNGYMLLDKFFSMNGVRGREYNLYFLSWMTNIRYCLDHGLKRYQSGQAAYENKLRLGCKLTKTTMYFKHKNRIVQGALRLVAPLLAADDMQERVAA